MNRFAHSHKRLATRDATLPFDVDIDVDFDEDDDDYLLVDYPVLGRVPVVANHSKTPWPTFG